MVLQHQLVVERIKMRTVEPLNDVFHRAFVEMKAQRKKDAEERGEKSEPRKPTRPTKFDRLGHRFNGYA